MQLSYGRVPRPNPRASFFMHYRDAGGHPGTRRGEEFGRTPWEISLANPSVAAAAEATTIGPANIFSSGGLPEVFTGAGASSRGCRE
jgi:hypothetical protein